MQRLKILFLNLGYARGIGGRLSEHIRFAHRHFYCPATVQTQVLQKFNALIATERPDLCCIVEIDKGAPGAMRNQIDALISEECPFSDIENKYSRKSFLRSFPLTAGNSNGFIARAAYPFEKLFFSCGTKRLVYKIRLGENLTLFFAHFALKRSVRVRQLLEAREWMRQEKGEVIFLGDFNILEGLGEITPLLDGGRFRLLNRTDSPTFFFHTQKHILDLCICSQAISRQASLKILPQPYTDHAALILEV
jgi:hypothetical protein